MAGKVPWDVGSVTVIYFSPASDGGMLQAGQGLLPRKEEKESIHVRAPFSSPQTCLAGGRGGDTLDSGKFPPSACVKFLDGAWWEIFMGNLGFGVTWETHFCLYQLKYFR